MSERRGANAPALETRHYSQRLGTISREQFQAALDHFGLGRVVSAEPITLGNWGQNCFLTSTAGEFVLRGNPFYSWQFLAEQFFAPLLHERTAVSIPWPYYVEQSTSIFGWSYAIMRRLPGQALAEKSFRDALDPASRLQIARSMGETLAALQELEWPVAGAYDPTTGGIRPSDAHDPAAEAHVLHGPPPGLDTPAYVRHFLKNAQAVAPEQTTDADAAWVERVIAAAEDALWVPFRPCFVMVDFQENNVVVEQDETSGAWRVTGVFDLAGTFFGDGEKALARQTGGYLSDLERARTFLQAYLARRPARPGLALRFPLYLLAQSLPVWIWAHSANKVWWDRRLTLREWTGLTTTSWQDLVKGST